MRRLRIALAQINTTVGDLDGNVEKIVGYAARAREAGADVVAFPELAVTGYPPEDLLLRRSFVRDNIAALERLIERAPRDVCVVAGFVDAEDDIYNAAAVVYGGELAGVYRKRFLPNYGVFDEQRYFQAGSEAPVFEIAGSRVGVNICEDIWYTNGPTRSQALAGAEAIVNINGSPYHAGKRAARERMIATRASDNVVPVCYLNMVGGQDELVFDGGSVVFDEQGELLARAAQFDEELLVVDLDIERVHQTRLHDPKRRQEKLEEDASASCPAIRVSGPALPRSTPRVGAACPSGQGIAPARDLPSPSGKGVGGEGSDLPSPSDGTSESGGARQCEHGSMSEGLGVRSPLERRIAETLSLEAEVYAALETGTRDYVRKTGFERVLVGLSGGIDSSIVAAIAVDALGAEHVRGVAMPSRYSSEGSIADASALAEKLGIELTIIPIEPAHAALLEMLERPFAGTAPGAAEENVQARIRGNVLMALSNKFGALVLTTGNKSEYATGYCTLYGDMAGGYAVIKDVPKTLVYRLAEYRNARDGNERIPRTIIEKPPSAELRPDQLDTDSLPPYEKLDPILEAYVEDGRSAAEIVAMGHDEALVQRVITMVDRNEYKRRQSPPGVKITPRAFGRDRRLPLANRYSAS